jgi:DNA-binding beta-propeller fold protein YncE
MAYLNIYSAKINVDLGVFLIPFKAEKFMRGMMTRFMKLVSVGVVSFAVLWANSNARAQDKSPLKLVQTILVPDLKDGDFDHFTVDLEGNRLFVTAEENSKVVIFDTKTNKLVHTISDLKAPHSMLFRGDLKKLFVVDSDLGEVKIYETDSYKPIGTIKVREGADSAGYDPSTKYLYVVDGGKDAKMPNAYLDVIDSTEGKKVGEIKIDSDDVEAMAFDKASPRMFIDVRGNSTIEVIDREKRSVLATWPIPNAKGLTTIAFDAANHRLLVGARVPPKLFVLDSDSGKIITSLDAAGMVDDMPLSPDKKRIYFAGTMFTDVFEQKDADHYEKIGHVPTAFRAKTAILVPELNRYYLAVPHHGKDSAAIRVYDVVQ